MESNPKPGTGKLRQELKAQVHGDKPLLSLRLAEGDEASARVLAAMARSGGLGKIRLEERDKAARRSLEALLEATPGLVILARLGHQLIVCTVERLIGDKSAESEESPGSQVSE